jgi:hypothetical protein
MKKYDPVVRKHVMIKEAKINSISMPKGHGIAVTLWKRAWVTRFDSPRQVNLPGIIHHRDTEFAELF